MQESIVFLVRVQCRRKESSRSQSHLLMSFFYKVGKTVNDHDRYMLKCCCSPVVEIKNY